VEGAVDGQEEVDSMGDGEWKEPVAATVDGVVSLSPVHLELAFLPL
jgi:hypothetical protein